MRIAYTAEQQALKAEIRSTMDRLMTDELRAELHETEGGISLSERASVSRLLREKAAVEKIVEEARSAAKKAG